MKSFSANWRKGTLICATSVNFGVRLKTVVGRERSATLEESNVYRCATSGFVSDRLGDTATIPLLIAEEPPAPPPAPVPSQIRAAKKIFISNGGEDTWLDYDPKHDPSLTYNELYADIKSWGKYELVSTPTDADIVFEIHLVFQEHSQQLRLLILDPKSHTTLWTLNQVANAANRDATARKNFDKAMNSLVAKIKDLVAKGKED